MNFKVIVSVGEALTGSPEKLKKIDACGDCIYRINGAHVDLNGMNAMTRILRGILPNPKIMLDLPGSKIRTRGLSEPISLIKDEMFELYDYQLNYPKFHTLIKPGDLILTNDSTITLEAREIKGSTIRILSHSDGLLQNNKGLHVRGIHREIPFLFQEDIDLIRAASDKNLDYLALSFVRTADDIREVKSLLAGHGNATTEIFAKVENAQAVENLGHIFKEVEHVNIDRGDLSADIGILKLPAVQERIVESAKRAGKSVYLATQFLKNMEQNPVPLIAEIIDLHKTIKGGVSGIQLSEETAIGKYSVECVKLVFDIFHQSFSA